MQTLRQDDADVDLQQFYVMIVANDLIVLKDIIELMHELIDEELVAEAIVLLADIYVVLVDQEDGAVATGRKFVDLYSCVVLVDTLWPGATGLKDEVREVILIADLLEEMYPLMPC